MSNAHATRVGFVGFGDQGTPMARAIAEAGFELHVWARRPQSLDELNGVPHVVHSTPDFAHEMTRLAAAYGVDVVDAPVSGGRAGAEAKRLVTIIGGESSVVDNALLRDNQDNLHDMLAIADGMRVDVSALVDVLRAGTGSSRALDSLGTAITTSNAVHLREMQLVDMETFSDAVRGLGDAAVPFTRRAVHGAQVLPELAERSTTLGSAPTVSLPQRRPLCR